MSIRPSISIKKDKIRSIERRHPWIFSGAISSVKGNPQPGDTIDVLGPSGEWLAAAAFCQSPLIAARIWSFNESEQIDTEFFSRRVEAAVKARSVLFRADPTRTAMRLLHGESDALPGVIADLYGDFIVVQFSTAGAMRFRKEICEALSIVFPGKSIFERSDSPAMTREGLEPMVGVVSGETPPKSITASWAGLKFNVDIAAGQKTGAYLDQADALPLVGSMARDAEVLDMFCYSGAFTMSAIKGGARSVTCVDSSAPALDSLSKNVELNGLDANKCEKICDDAFMFLRKMRDSRRTFDMIILDPPKFADSKGKVEKACRAYKDINLLAFKLLRPGGKLATFSCSGAVGPELFQKVVSDAALDARRFARFFARTGQAPDHPVSFAFPEGLYLKGLLCDTF